MLDDCLNYKEESSLGGEQLTLTGWVGGWVTGRVARLSFNLSTSVYFSQASFSTVSFCGSVCISSTTWNWAPASYDQVKFELWTKWIERDRTVTEGHSYQKRSIDGFRIFAFLFLTDSLWVLFTKQKLSCAQLTGQRVYNVHSSKCCSSDLCHPFRFGFFTHAFSVVLYPFRHKFI